MQLYAACRKNFFPLNVHGHTAIIFNKLSKLTFGCICMYTNLRRKIYFPYKFTVMIDTIVQLL